MDAEFIFFILWALIAIECIEEVLIEPTSKKRR